MKIRQEKKIDSIDITNVEGDGDAFIQRAKGIIDRIVQTQSLQVDAVSGATFSSNGIISAVKNALTGEASNTQPAAATTAPSAQPSKSSEVADYKEAESGYKDGVYYGRGQGFGGVIKVKLVIQKGKIDSVDIIKALNEGSTYLDKAKGIIPTIIKKQSPNVDAVSGATYSSNGIMSAVQDALSQAEKDPKQQDKEKKKKKDSEKNQTDKATEKQTQTANDVDTVSGATFSSKGIINAIKKALAKAAKGILEAVENALETARIYE